MTHTGQTPAHLFFMHTSLHSCVTSGTGGTCGTTISARTGGEYTDKVWVYPNQALVEIAQYRRCYLPLHFHTIRCNTRYIKCVWCVSSEFIAKYVLPKILISISDLWVRNLFAIHAWIPLRLLKVAVQFTHVVCITWTRCTWNMFTANFRFSY